MDIFFVIADPTRRVMIEMMGGGERPAGDFVAAFPSVSQPAISQHLKVLRDAGLVEVRAERQRRFYRLKPDSMAPVRVWASQIEATDRATPTHLETISPPAKEKSPPKRARRAEPVETLDLFG